MYLRSRKTRVLLIVLLLAALLPYGWYRYQDWRAGKELADVIAELDRTAGPWRLPDLEANRKPIPNEQNGALIVTQACPTFPRKDKPVLQDFKLPPWKQLTPDQAVALREYLESVQPHVRTALKLADVPRGRFAIAVADTYQGSVPHIDELTVVSSLLHHEIWRQIQQGDFEQAARSCRAVLHSARTLREPRYALDCSVRLRLTSEVATLLERMLAQGQPDEALLAPLLQMLLEEVDFEGWGPAIAAERAGIHWMFENLESGKIDLHKLRRESAYRVSWTVYLRDEFISANVRAAHAWALRYCTDALACLNLPPRERLAKLHELEERAVEAPEPAKTFAAFRFAHFYRVNLRFESKIRCGIVGLAAERFRRQHERWPNNMNELVPAFLPVVQLDPYTGEPLKLRATPDGIAIYSPGPDGAWRGDARDDATLSSDDARFDHEFRLWNVNRRRR